MVPGQVQVGRRNESRQAAQQVQRREDQPVHSGGVWPGARQLVEHPAIRKQREALLRERSPRHLLLTILAGLINREQQEIIEYLRAEIQVLKEAPGRRRIRLDDHQRRRLAVRGKALGRRILGEIGTAFSPDTILRWHRQLVAEKWDCSDRRRRVGRPRVRPEIVELVLRMARENPTWGYDRIQGALANLGHQISDTTVGTILREHGIEPVPQRKRQSTWKEFL
jgi:putative transposase